MKRKYRILHIAECAGGVERYLAMLLPLLEKDFHQTLLCSNNYDVEKFVHAIDCVEQIDMQQSFSPRRVIKEVMAIRRSVRKNHPDLVYCHSSFAGALGRLALIGIPCKVVYNPHGWAFNIR